MGPSSNFLDCCHMQREASCTLYRRALQNKCRKVSFVSSMCFHKNASYSQMAKVHIFLFSGQVKYANEGIESM